jgi:hypothetical protein
VGYGAVKVSLDEWKSSGIYVASISNCKVNGEHPTILCNVFPLLASTQRSHECQFDVQTLGLSFWIRFEFASSAFREFFKKKKKKKKKIKLRLCLSVCLSVFLWLISTPKPMERFS